MKLRAVPGEHRYAVAVREGSDLWLTLWVRRSREGERSSWSSRTPRSRRPSPTSTTSERTRREFGYVHHLEIAEAITARDAEAARRAMQKHMTLLQTIEFADKETHKSA